MSNPFKLTQVAPQAIGNGPTTAAKTVLNQFSPFMSKPPGVMVQGNLAESAPKANQRLFINV